MKKSAILFLLLFISAKIFAQGTFSGDLMMNLNSFQRDTNIRAAGNPLYDNYLSGSEAWLSLRYNIKGFTFFLRADGFNNSNLKNNTSANTDFGVGAWSITKEMKDLSITVGTIYDQIGSGILFRAYENRGLLIDNGLVGLQLKYNLTNNISLKAFTGQQKNNNAVNNLRYGPVIRGFNAEGDYSIGKVHIVPGVGFIDRTLDANSMNQVVGNINSQPLETRFVPMYNVYGFTGYNTLTYKGFSWYAEGAYKTHEALNEYNLLVDKPGNVQYTSLNYGRKGVALSLTGKRTEHFLMKTSPNELKNEGYMNWQPVVAVLRPERLMSRYTPASQDISELAGTANLNLAPNDVTNFTLTYTSINTLDNIKLYREGFVEGYYQGLKSWIFQGGVQYMEYNVSLYQTRSDTPQTLFAITPFVEATYRISDLKSVRAEVQYMSSKQDYGSWIFALLEYSIAPKWSFSLSDMYNVRQVKNAYNPNHIYPGFASKKADHYYNIFVAYTKGAHRFTLAYVKQIDGINCTGGVCRYEPAFNGVKATVTSSF
ncbi:MAG: hypothetical protein JWQ38_2837 [Flavipsychrobacter sp.]|nr:hypothetical protein [Flavipsychrobacter sp.]